MANPEVDVDVNVSKNLLNVSNVPFYVYRPYNFKFHVCKFVSYLFLLFSCYHNCNLDVETVGMVNVCVSNVFICCSRVLWVLCDMFSWNFIKHSIFLCFYIFLVVFRNWNQKYRTKQYQFSNKWKYLFLKKLLGRKRKRVDAINHLLNELGIVICILLLYSIQFHCLSKKCSSVNDHEPSHLQVENYIANANNFQSGFLQNLIVKYACSRISKLSAINNHISSYAHILLLLSGDIEKNPGPSNWSSFSDPNMCGYFRGTLFVVFYLKQKLIPENVSSTLTVDDRQGFKDMLNMFQEHYEAHIVKENFDVEFKKIKKNISRFEDMNKKWGKTNCNDRDDYYDFFSPVNWQKMEESQKNKHSVICEECMKSFSDVQAKFNSRSPKYQQKRKQNLGYVAKELATTLKKTKKNKITDVTNTITNVLNETFEKTLGVSFSESYAKCNNLEKKKTPEENRVLKRRIARDICKKLEYENNSTVVDRIWGGRLSLNQWNFQRKIKSFETVSEAKNPTSEEKLKISTGVKKEKDHVGNFSAYNIRAKELEQLALSWTNETPVNSQDIGREYITGKYDNKIPGNCGQIAKDYLFDKESKGGFQFVYKGKNNVKKDRVRRARKRTIGKVSVPTEVNADRAKKFLKEEFDHEKIDLGIPIVSRTYRKNIVNKKTGNVEVTEFTVDGRKHLLRNLREKFLIKHRQYMRLNPNSYFENIKEEELVERLRLIGELVENEDLSTMKMKLKTFERSRNLQLWHDASTITNHSHILFCVNVLYDPAVFYTQQEYKSLTGSDVNIQRKVEQPELYIIGRCRNNDEQLAYIETRIECLKDLRTGIYLDERF